MLQPGISIVIPCYNAGHFLIKAIDSITKQPFKYPHEIIIVDDASPDNATKQSLEEIKDRPNVRVIELTENKGAQHARNTGIYAAAFEHILMMDADDCLNTSPAVLEHGTYTDRAIDILQQQPDIAFVECMTVMFGNRSGYINTSYPITEALILAKHHVSTWIIYRKEDAIKAGLYDEDIQKWQDWTFAVALLNARHIEGKPNNIAYLKTPYYLYRDHQETDRISKRPIDEQKMIAVTVRKYPQIFKAQYPDLEPEQIAYLINFSKPDSITNLLYVAADNLRIALQIVKRRGAQL